MIALIDLYRKELLKVNGFSPSTVETYTLSIKAFCRFAKNELQTDPPNVTGPQLLKWILYLKNTGIGHSRIENHHYALKSFFAFGYEQWSFFAALRMQIVVDDFTNTVRQYHTAVPSSFLPDPQQATCEVDILNVDGGQGTGSET